MRWKGWIFGAALAVMPLMVFWGIESRAKLGIATGLAKADRVWVDKSERVVRLYSGPDVIATYDVALGFNPVGDKAKEGDGRTPEGNYRLDWRNDRSAFHLAIHVSYPNAKDRDEARQAGASPGGDIFVHGSPNWWPFESALPFADWTSGCIALSNRDMRDFWARVDDGTPLEITP